MPETLTATTHVGITRLAGQIGAEITGADTGTPLSDEVVARIRQALLDHKVVFLRGQSLNYRRQVAFAERLGPLTLGHPTLASPPGQPLLEEIDSLKGGKVNYWHTDVTFVDRPPAFTLLHAVVIPPVGGDTLWANTVTAYESLPPELRDLADRLRVLHTNDFDYARTFNRGERVDPALAAAHEEFVSTVYETEHPAVRVHPETNERVVYVNPSFTREIVDLAPRESRHVLDLLFEQIARPEYAVRFKWEPGSVAFWDNRAALHLAPRDFEHVDGDRILHRITLVGEIPVGPDGRESESLAGDFFGRA